MTHAEPDGFAILQAIADATTARQKTLSPEDVRALIGFRSPGPVNRCLAALSAYSALCRMTPPTPKHIK